MWVNFLLVALGGGLGACSRYGIGLAVLSTPLISNDILANFPLQTFFVNVLGCFIIGFASQFFLQSNLVHKNLWQLFLVPGFLGGFTTFSTFSLESITLLTDEKILLGMLYAGGTLVACLIAAFLGFTLGRIVFGR